MAGYGGANKTSHTPQIAFKKKPKTIRHSMGQVYENNNVYAAE